MIKYLEEVKELAHVFGCFEVQQIPREENSWANSLAKVITTTSMVLPNGAQFQQVKKLAIKEPPKIM